MFIVEHQIKVAHFEYHPLSVSDNEGFMSDGDRFSSYEEEFLNSSKIVSRAMNQLSAANGSQGTA